MSVAPKNPVADAVASALRWASYSLANQHVTLGDLNDVADQVEVDWDGGTCPMCQHVDCNPDCPLVEIRRPLVVRTEER